MVWATTKQWRLGAHYTHEADIQKVVQPTIVQPWLERIDALTKHKDAVAAHYDLLNYVVLDPACGSGNFLYVAYRELRRIEVRLLARLEELRAAEGRKQLGTLSLFPLSNLKGIEIDGFAVALARVTLWMGHKLAVNELALTESTLPLGDLSGIRVGDALRMDWPRADAIIGNPPFHGTKSLRSALGDDYVDWLSGQFGVGVKDYCVYWFRKTHGHLGPGKRAGLVGTNSIAEGKNREASLDYIVSTGGILTDAVRSQDWPGDAAVHVAIVNWIKEPEKPPASFRLDGQEVAGLSTGLTGSSADFRASAKLAANERRQFFGVVQSGAGFILSDTAAKTLLDDRSADYGKVVRRFLVGDDITSRFDQAPSRWIVYFAEMSLEEAMEYPRALDVVRILVKPDRDRHKKARERDHWWKFSRTVPELFDATAPLSRWIACPATAKRFFMTWCEPGWVPSNATSVFAFETDESFGVLSSSLHTQWATAQSTMLETRPRYTVSSFATFPWPDGNLDAVADISRRLYARRSEICLERQIGLTKLYNQVDDGAWHDLADLHAELDEAVAAAYGWPRSVAHDPDETNRRLLELNRSIAAGEVDYSPFN